jgi:hypothetical protein
MNACLQIPAISTGALLCAGGWFALWLLAFRPPLPSSPPPEVARPEFTRLIADEQTLDKLKTPTLFALPSAEGFSGQFIDDRIHLPPSTGTTPRPERYLPPATAAAPGVDLTLLTAETALTQSALPLPGTALRPTAPMAAAPRPQLFLSPELVARGPAPAWPAAWTGPVLSVRAEITVRPDGSVAAVLLNEPSAEPLLLPALLRQLRFSPAERETTGWIDVRLMPETTP